MKRIALDFLTVRDATQPEMIDMAAELGYDAVSPLMVASWQLEGCAMATIMPGSKLARDVAGRLAATGMRPMNVEGFLLTQTVDPASYRPFLELGASMGAKSAIGVIFDDDPGRSTDNFCRLCEEAGSFGLNVSIEFMPMHMSFVKTLDDALALLNTAGQPNARLQIDLLHLTVSGGSPADIGRVDPALISSAQLCDGPARMTYDEYMHCAMAERRLPGKGDLPVADFLRALPEHAVIGLEIPMDSMTRQGISPRERARLCLDAARRCLSAQ